MKICGNNKIIVITSWFTNNEISSDHNFQIINESFIHFLVETWNILTVHTKIQQQLSLMSNLNTFLLGLKKTQSFPFFEGKGGGKQKLKKVTEYLIHIVHKQFLWIQNNFYSTMKNLIDEIRFKRYIILDTSRYKYNKIPSTIYIKCKLEFRFVCLQLKGPLKNSNVS